MCFEDGREVAPAGTALRTKQRGNAVSVFVETALNSICVPDVGQQAKMQPNINTERLLAYVVCPRCGAGEYWILLAKTDGISSCESCGYRCKTEIFTRLNVAQTRRLLAKHYPKPTWSQLLWARYHAQVRNMTLMALASSFRHLERDFSFRVLADASGITDNLFHGMCEGRQHYVPLQEVLIYNGWRASTALSSGDNRYHLPAKSQIPPVAVPRDLKPHIDGCAEFGRRGFCKH